MDGFVFWRMVRGFDFFPKSLPIIGLISDQGVNCQPGPGCSKPD